MSVFFLQPLYLYGLAAAALPILIHLLNRRRMKRMRFPAVRFILLSQKRISRSYRLRHWLLLALRTLAVVFLALLLANPIFQTGAGLFAGGGPVSLVVVLDNSLSMTWSGDGNGFKRAKEAARLMISALGDGDRAAVIPASVSTPESFRLKTEKEVLLRDLERIEIADGTADLGAALARAYELLSEPGGQKEIRLITDMALTDWDRFSLASMKRVDPSIPLKAIRIGSGKLPFNATVKEIRLRGQGVGANLPLAVDAIVANFGAGEIKDLLVQLNIEGQGKEQKLVSIPPHGENTVSFQTRLTKPGAHAGQVILKKEGLAGNPTAHFTLDAQDKIKILLVDGDPQTALVQSETFFLARALNPAGEKDASIFLPTVIIPDGLNSASLEAYQVVALCNLATVPDALLEKLRNFLRQGGGLLIFTGDRAQLENYNAKLYQGQPPLLPVELREKKLGAEASGERLDKIDLAHPALQALSDAILQQSLKSARVWGYARAAAPGKGALISLANGDPLLLEQRVGAGRVLVFTTAADRDWSDLPLKTAYLPLMHALASYLASASRGALDSGIEVGSAKEFSLPPSYVGKSLRITRPDKQVAELTLSAAKERAVAAYPDNQRAGIYRVDLPGAAPAGAAPQLYAVNAPFLESRLEPIGERELQAKLKPLRIEVLDAEALERGGTRLDLALPLLGLLIITLLSEGWLAQRL